MRLWVVAALAITAVIAAIVVALRWSDGAREDLESQLNDRYVETIELRSEARGGTHGGRREIVIIDGVTRRDCRAVDGWLDCSGNPQPTRG